LGEAQGSFGGLYRTVVEYQEFRGGIDFLKDFVLTCRLRDGSVTKRRVSSGLSPGWEALKPLIDRDEPGCRTISAQNHFMTAMDRTAA